MCLHDPYTTRVKSLNPFAVVVINSLLTVKIPLPRIGSIESANISIPPREVFHVAAFSPFQSHHLPCEVSVSLFVKNIKQKFTPLGMLETKNQMLNFETQMPVTAVRFRVSSTTSKFSHTEETLVEDVLNIFHNTCINPALGALDAETLFRHLFCSHATRCNFISLLQLLQHFSELCHCYIGKSGCWQVVLKSAAKRLQLDGKGSQYISLLEFVVLHPTSEATISDMFSDLQRKGVHNGILGSNFTILKKFLNKYNKQFRWFQDQQTKTTKVVVKCCA